jgi:uncharacterized protein (UPF0276 family)
VEPVSFSATALDVFELCPSRYVAESYHKAQGFNKTAANTGSACHGALELYVKRTIMEQLEEPSFETLSTFFDLSYAEVFGTHNRATEEYMDGYDMLKRWHSRTSWEKVKRVVSCEVKDNFAVPTSLGDRPFNYIWDRFDEMKEEGTYRVVDYKSNRWSITPADLKKKIQARAYALAAAIQLHAQGIEAQRVWVEFDLLRHGTVATVFSRDDNIETWLYIKRQAQKIINTNETEAQEKLNDLCRFCIRAISCDALKKNVAVGGLLGLGSVEEAIDIRAQLEWQYKGLENLIKDLDQNILAKAKVEDRTEYESDMNRLSFTRSNNRRVDAEMIEMAIGTSLFEKYGGKSITMGSVDKLIKSKDLTPEKKAEVVALIYNVKGEPKVKIQTKNPIDGM